MNNHYVYSPLQAHGSTCSTTVLLYCSSSSSSREAERMGQGGGVQCVSDLDWDYHLLESPILLLDEIYWCMYS